MNILVLTPLYYIEGRPELFHDTSAIHYLVKYWVKEGHNVQVIVTYVNYRRQIKRYMDKEQRKYWKEGYSYTADGVSVYLIEEQLIFNKDWFTGINNHHIVKMAKSHLKRVGFEPDVIVNHFPCYSSRYLSMLGFKAPCIAVLHQTDINKGKNDLEHRELLKRNYKEIFCRSKTIFEEASKWGLSNLQDKIIYSGAPIAEAPENKIFDFSNTIKVLYVGKLIKRKNIDLIIKMLQRFEKMHLCIIGEGDELDALQELTKSLKVDGRVEFLGGKTREEVISYMREADVFCMPSVRETFGLVYLEAMSQGCLSIGTAGEGIDGIMKDDINGFLCEATETGLEEVFKRIIGCSSDKLKMISDAAIETGSQFSEENVSEEYLKLVVKAVHSNDEYKEV